METEPKPTQKNAIAERMRLMADRIERFGIAYELLREPQVHDTLNELDAICKDAHTYLDAIVDLNDCMDTIQQLAAGKPVNETIKEKEKAKMQTMQANPESTPVEVEVEIDHNLDLGDPVGKQQPHKCAKTVCNPHSVIQPHKNEKSTSADAMCKKAKCEAAADKYLESKKKVAEVIIRKNKAVPVGELIAATGFAENYLNEFIFCPFFKWTEGGYIMTPLGNQTFRD